MGPTPSCGLIARILRNLFIQQTTADLRLLQLNARIHCVSGLALYEYRTPIFFFHFGDFIVALRCGSSERDSREVGDTNEALPRAAALSQHRDLP